VEEKAAAADPSAAVETIRLGPFPWTHDALDRLNRVPEGFMRDMTREKIEDYARQHEVPLVTLAVADKGIEVGRQLMAEMIAGYSQTKNGIQADDDRRGETAAAPTGKAALLNEIPRMPGTHP
jgi:hypothetical protein